MVGKSSMDSEPAEFVCIDCNLRFKNSGTYEKHKKKFCQGRRENSWSPTKSARTGFETSMQNAQLRRPTANSDFWAGKTNTARSQQSFSSRLGDMTNADRKSSKILGGFNYVKMNSKHSSELEDLQAEQMRLEEHKRAIQEKLVHIRADRKRAMTIDTVPHQENHSPLIARRSEDTRNRKRSIEERILDMHQFLVAKDRPQGNGYMKTAYDPETGNNYLSYISNLKHEYRRKGGNDLRMLSLLQNLEADAYKANNNGSSINNNNTVSQLQQQLMMYQKTNQSLMEELQKLSRQRGTNGDAYHMKLPGNQTTAGRYDVSNFHEQRLMEMRQEAEIYKHQLELERLRHELQTIRGGMPQMMQLPQLPAIPQNQQQQNMVMTERDMNVEVIDKSDQVFERSPYDPGSGFALFWDFLCGIPVSSDNCRLLVTMYKDNQAISETKALPIVPCNQQHGPTMPQKIINGRTAVLGVKQVFPRCFPMQLVTIIAQVRAGSQHDVTFESMKEMGWSKVEIFDSMNRVIAGRWKIPVRTSPMMPQLLPAELNSIQQVDGCELYYRLINTRDADSQDNLVLQEQQTGTYKYPPLEHQTLPVASLSLEPHRTIISRPESIEKPRKHSTRTKRRSPTPSLESTLITPSPVQRRPRKEITPVPISPVFHKQPTPVSVPKEPTPVQEPTPQPARSPSPSIPNIIKTDFVGIQLDKLYDLHETTARLQITLYGSDGKVMLSEQKPASKRTQYCRSPFLKSVLGFALEEVHFPDVHLSPNSFIVIEVYKTAAGGFLTLNSVEENEEELVCWTALRLSSSLEEPERMTSLSRNSDLSDEKEEVIKINTGRHDVTLYSPPLPDIRHLRSRIKNNQDFDAWESYGASYISLFLFSKSILPPALPSDIPIYTQEETCPVGAWVEGDKRDPPTTIFKNGDGFELYVDAARFMADNCAFTKVICTLYDSNFTRLKEEFESDINLNLSPHNPDFDLKFEFRDFSYPPTASILFKVYMIETLTQQAHRLGMAVLPVFVKPGTLDRADDSDKKFCLNQGCFQLKLFNELKNTDRLIRNSLDRPVLCTSLLVRLLLAPCHSDGQPKQAIEFLEDQWESEGLLVPKPSYESGKYESADCVPTVMECRIFHSLIARTQTTIREVFKVIVEGKKAKNDQGLIDVIKNTVRNLANSPTADITYLSKYNSKHGILFSVDSAQNLPWNGFTFATYCFSPPSSFYRGKLDDPAVLVTKLDLDGLIRLPKWTDGIKVFPRRRSHSNMVMIVHLYHVLITQRDEQISYSFGTQAWTVIPVCNREYANHGYFQVGLFHGTPTLEVLNSLENEPLIQTIANLRKKKTVKLVDGASVFIRIGDARRREELEDVLQLKVRRTFLPRGNKFINPVQSRKFATLIPAEQNSEEYGKVLASKFRMLAGQAFQQRIAK